MRRIPPRLRIWAPIAALALLLAALVARPMAVGWRCYQLHATGEHAEALVVGKAPSGALVLEVATGTRAGGHCTADTSEAHFAAAAPGDVLQVVLPDARPGECVLAGTLENSAALLWGVGSSGVVLALLLVLGGLFLERTFTQPATLTTRFDLSGLACPRCRTPMGEGYLPLLAGLHWREPSEPVGLPHALAGLPGTVGWRGRPRLHAWRCPSCEIVTFRYGKAGR